TDPRGSRRLTCSIVDLALVGLEDLRLVGQAHRVPVLGVDAGASQQRLHPDRDPLLIAELVPVALVAGPAAAVLVDLLEELGRLGIPGALLRSALPGACAPAAGPVPVGVG